MSSIDRDEEKYDQSRNLVELYHYYQDTVGSTPSFGEFMEWLEAQLLKEAFPEADSSKGEEVEQWDTEQ